jgi:hypothetical protein
MLLEIAISTGIRPYWSLTADWLGIGSLDRFKKDGTRNKA